jgi:hypothetical protein
MNSKRSMWKLLCGVAGVGLLVTNCTLKTDDNDGKAGASNASAGAGNASNGNCSPVGMKFSGCICAGNVVSYQVCTAEGIYGACVCDDTSGGGASNGGAPSGGASGALNDAGAAATEAGAGGDTALNIDPTDCGSCLTQLCSDEYDACAAESETTTVDPAGNYCLAEGADAPPGQIELILTCITTARAMGLVKRDAVRACGATIGQSADPESSPTDWPPQSMTPATENLVNCMADAPDETMPGAWATDDTKNFPASGPRPWDDMTCAKLACTSAL